MKALSIRQPWVWCILHAGKDIENRDWSTRYRGKFLIHASKGMTHAEYENCLATCHDVSLERPFASMLTMPDLKDLQRGGIVGIAELVDCIEMSNATMAISPWFFGAYGFLLRNVRPLPFIPCNGRLGFFDVPGDVWDK